MSSIPATRDNVLQDYLKGVAPLLGMPVCLYLTSYSPWFRPIGLVLSARYFLQASAPRQTSRFAELKPILQVYNASNNPEDRAFAQSWFSSIDQIDRDDAIRKDVLMRAGVVCGFLACVSTISALYSSMFGN